MRHLFFSRNAAAGLAAVVLGIFFFVASNSIQGFGDDPVGPQFLPKAVSVLIALFGVLLIVQSRSANRLGTDANNRVEATPISVNVLLLAAASVLYSALFFYLGFVLSSAVVLPAVLCLFGIRTLKGLSVMTILTISAFYIFFFVALGVHDPPGQLIDISGWYR